MMAAPSRSPERQTLADAIAALRAIDDEDARLRAVTDDWEGRSEARDRLEAAEAELDRLQKEARDLRLEALLHPDVKVEQVSDQVVEDAEKAVERARRDLKNREDVSNEMRRVMTDPQRQARRVSAEIAVENARAAVIEAELPREDYIQGRLAGAAYLALRRALPVPRAEELSAAAAPWLAWETALMRGDVDAPSPGLSWSKSDT